jgi:hypothetical protein
VKIDWARREWSPEKVRNSPGDVEFVGAKKFGKIGSIRAMGYRETKFGAGVRLVQSKSRL